MSPLTRVATLATIGIGALAVTAAPAVAATASPTGPTGSPTPSAQDAQYLQQAHQTNLYEIAAGKMAQQKGNTQTVKNLGKKFVTDHTNLDHSLVPVAQQLGVSLPSAPNADQQAVNNRLKTVSGPQFDNLFVTSQLAGHTRAMQANETEIASGSNPKAVNVAKQSAPVIAAHHKALVAAAQALGIPLPGTPAPGTSSPAPTVSPSGPSVSPGESTAPPGETSTATPGETSTATPLSTATS